MTLRLSYNCTSISRQYFRGSILACVPIRHVIRSRHSSPSVAALHAPVCVRPPPGNVKAFDRALAADTSPKDLTHQNTGSDPKVYSSLLVTVPEERDEALRLEISQLQLLFVSTPRKFITHSIAILHALSKAAMSELWTRFPDKETIPVLASTFHSFWARSGSKVREAGQNVARLHLHVSGLRTLLLT